MAGKIGLTRKNANNAIDGIISAIRHSLERNEKVTLVDFGTFKVRRRKARTGVNPQTREKLDIPAKNIVKCTAGRKLKEKII